MALARKGKDNALIQRYRGVNLAVLALGIGLGAAWGSPPVMQVDEKPFFPIGWFTSTAPSSQELANQHLRRMRNHGMNCALACYSVSSSSNSIIYMGRYLEGGAVNGMKIMLENKRCAVRALPACPLSMIDEEVDALKDYPALLGWYLIDEPEFQGAGTTPEVLPLRYRQVKERDTVGHPIFVVHAAYAPNLLWAEEYLRAGTYCDVLMTDTYPVLGNVP